MADRKNSRATDAYDLTRVTAFRLAALSNRLTLWASRVYGREFGVSVLEWRVLAALRSLGTVTARDIAEFTVLDKSNVSRAVHRLTARGLIERGDHPADGRSKVLSLTRNGTTLHDRIAVRSKQREEQMFHGFSASERKTFIALLDRFDARAETLLTTTER